MPLFKRLLLMLLAIFVALPLTLNQANSHAGVTETVPKIGESFTSSPRKIVIKYGEAVRLISAELVDGTLNPINIRLPSNRYSNEFSIPVDLGSNPSTYLFSIRVVSKDGHPISTSIPFNIGLATINQIKPGARKKNPFVIRNIFRTALYVSIIFLAGYLINAMLVGAAIEILLFAYKYIKYLLVANVLFLVLYTAFTIIDFSDGRLSTPRLSAAFEAFIYSSELNRLIMCIVGLACSTIIYLAVRLPHIVRIALYWLAVFFLLGSFVAAGHTKALDNKIISLVLFAHMVCLSFWVGSFPFLLKSLLTVRNKNLLPPIEKFTKFIPYFLIGLIVTGVTLTLEFVPNVEMLANTPYGVLLAAKFIVILALLAIGTANKFFIFPYVKKLFENNHPEQAKATGFSVISNRIYQLFIQVIKFDHGLAVLVIFLTASLSVFGPKSGMSSMRPQAPMTLNFENGATAVFSRPKPSTLPQSLTFSGYSLDQLPTSIESVELSAKASFADIPDIKWLAKLEGSAPGEAKQYHFDNIQLPLAGSWILKLLVRVDDFDSVELEIPVDITTKPAR